MVAFVPRSGIAFLPRSASKKGVAPNHDRYTASANQKSLLRTAIDVRSSIRCKIEISARRCYRDVAYPVLYPLVSFTFAFRLGLLSLLGFHLPQIDVICGADTTTHLHSRKFHPSFCLSNSEKAISTAKSRSLDRFYDRSAVMRFLSGSARRNAIAAC